jgi:hypothetical protein
VATRRLQAKYPPDFYLQLTIAIILICNYCSFHHHNGIRPQQFPVLLI